MAGVLRVGKPIQQKSFQKYSTNRLELEAPMLNPMVLESVFRSCDAPTLKRCRLVCTLWRNVSLESWRRTAVFKLTEIPFITEGLQLWEHIEKIQHSKVAGNENTLRKTFRSYSLTGVNFFEESDQAFRFFEGDFHSFPLGIFVTRLHLSMCGFSNNNCFTRLLSLVPNLRELSLLNNVHFDRLWEMENPNSANLNRRVELVKLTKLNICLDDHGGFTNYEESWLDFFRQFPNLKAISVGYPNFWFDDYRDFDGLLDAIGIIRGEDEAKLQIKSLDMLNVEEKGIEVLPTFTLDLIATLDLKLTNLKIDVGTKTPQTNLRKLLMPHSSTLEELTLFRLPILGPFANFEKVLCGQHKMSCLRSLYLHGNLVDSLGFLKSTPNLQRLQLFADKSEYVKNKYPANFQRRRTSARIQKDIVAKTISKYDMSGVQLTKLEILEGDFQVLSSLTFLQLTNWMPNVVSVFVPLTKDTFQVVCQKWRHSLVNLSIPKWCALDDEAITGWIPGEDGGFRGEGVLPPNITNLQNLISFSMETNGELSLEHGEECRHTMASLSDYSINHGFMKLPHLTHLVMHTVLPLLKSTVTALKERRLKLCKVIQGFTQCTCGMNRLVKKPETTGTCVGLSYSQPDFETSFWRSAVTLEGTPDNLSRHAERVMSHIDQEFSALHERAIED